MSDTIIIRKDMQAQTNLLPSEPETHADNTKGCLEHFGCQDNHLNNQELQSFHALKAEANILFEQQERWDLVQSLYKEYFKQEPKRSGKEWMRLGFQGQYPETDFRGGGVLSLQVVCQFARKNRPLVQVMQQDKAGFFFAITAINIAFYMKKYFHLADFLVAGKDHAVYCSRRALKNFCRLLIDNQSSYFQINETLLKHFYNNLWVPAQRSNTQTLLQFNDLFKKLTDRLRQTFQDNELRQLADFREVFSRLQ